MKTTEQLAKEASLAASVYETARQAHLAGQIPLEEVIKQKSIKEKAEKEFRKSVKKGAYKDIEKSLKEKYEKK